MAFSVSREVTAKYETETGRVLHLAAIGSHSDSPGSEWGLFWIDSVGGRWVAPLESLDRVAVGLISPESIVFSTEKFTHFKGGQYEALCVGMRWPDRNLPSLENYVVYRSVKDGKIWFRPEQEFLGKLERDGYSGPRFFRPS